MNEAEAKYHRMKKLGTEPYGATEPPVYVCGQCRQAQVEPEQGLCDVCDAMLRRAM